MMVSTSKFQKPDAPVSTIEAGTRNTITGKNLYPYAKRRGHGQMLLNFQRMIVKCRVALRLMADCHTEAVKVVLCSDPYDFSNRDLTVRHQNIQSYRCFHCIGVSHWLSPLKYRCSADRGPAGSDCCGRPGNNRRAQFWRRTPHSVCRTLGPFQPTPSQPAQCGQASLQQDRTAASSRIPVPPQQCLSLL